MKKNFFTICFSLILLLPTANCFAKVIPLDSPEMQSAKAQNTPRYSDLKMPNPNDQEAVRSFFKKRFEEAARLELPKGTDLSSPTSVGVIHTPEYYERQKEQKKPFFQKLYEKTLASLNEEEGTSSDNNTDEDQTERELATAATRFFTLAEPDTQTQRQAQFPTVSVALPSGRRILAPAREHIPYFLSYIDIQANGYIKVEDTITVVANNRRLARGLNRVFPKVTGKHQKIDFVLEKVTINNREVPYTIEEIGDNIVLTPKYNHKLEPGVYTYKFNYIINNKMQRRKNKIFLDWSITGQPMNIFITSANTIVSVPTGHSFDEIAVVIGSNNRFSGRRTNRFNLASNVVAFSNYTPLFQGERMHVVAMMNKSVFLKDFDKNFSHFITNWGTLLYAAIGLLAILGSFILSFLNLRHEQKSSKYTPSYNGALMRSISIGKYDRLAFVAQILDLFRKNAIDIKQDNGRVFLYRRDVDGNRLTSVEKRGIKQLFRRKSDVTEVNNANTILFKKSRKIFEKFALKQIKKYRLIHNLSYILFSTAMLMLTEIFIAFISVNVAQTLIILMATTLMYAFYIWILRHRFQRWYIALPIKLLILVGLFVIWAFSGIYVGGICSFLILIMVAIIFAFTRIFNEHNNFINDAKTAISNYKEYLIGNADTINLSRGFVHQQSNIFTLGISEYFPQNATNKSFYRLDVADTLKQLLIGII